MKIILIQLAAVFAQLSVSSPLVQASNGSSNTNEDIIQKQENDAINPIVTTSSSSKLLRGAANSAWNFLVASDGIGKKDDKNNEDVILTCDESCSCTNNDYP